MLRRQGTPAPFQTAVLLYVNKLNKKLYLDICADIAVLILPKIALIKVHFYILSTEICHSQKKSPRYFVNLPISQRCSGISLRFSQLPIPLGFSFFLSVFLSFFYLEGTGFSHWGAVSAISTSAGWWKSWRCWHHMVAITKKRCICKASGNLLLDTPTQVSQ